MPTLNQILQITRSGMLTRLLDLDVVSHNLANMNTVGYKSSRSNFQELLDEKRQNGVQLQTTQQIMDQGALRETSNPLDLAINGEGFLALNLPDGRTAYTRDGQLMLDAERRIVNSNGFPVTWEGEIPEGTQEIRIYPDGKVMALQGEEWNEAGTIQLSRFDNPSGLEGFGSNLWLQTDVSGEAQAGQAGTEGFGEIVSRALEGSNVNIANEMTQLVALQRSFQLSLRTFQQTDQMMSQAIHMRQG